MLIINNIKQTCNFCPSQWEFTLTDGRMGYIRYRWGHLSVRISENATTDLKDAVYGEEVFGKVLGGDYDGILLFSELKKQTDHLLDYAL